MADQEVVLRHIAFSRHKLDEYRQHASFDAFLSDITDSLERLDESEHNLIVETFDRAMQLAYEVFGRVAFRKREDTPLNRALFDVWSVVLLKPDARDIRARKTQIAEGLQDALQQDDELIRSVTQATGDPARVEYRFKKGREIVDEALR